MNKKLILVVSLLLTVGLLTGCGCKKKENKKEDNVAVNTNKEVTKDQKVDGIDIRNTSLVTTNGVSKLTTTVTNNTKKDYKLKKYVIVIKDKNNKVMIKLPGTVGKEVIKAGESRTINSSVAMDLSQAASVEYKVEK